MQENRLQILMQGILCGKAQIQIQLWKCDIFQPELRNHKGKLQIQIYYNKTDMTPTILDGGNEIILANWPTDKHIICNINNDIPIKIPSNLCILVNRSVLCNCVIEAENYLLQESLAVCQGTNSNLIIYFIVNTAFINYLD